MNSSISSRISWLDEEEDQSVLGVKSFLQVGRDQEGFNKTYKEKYFIVCVISFIFLN